MLTSSGSCSNAVAISAIVVGSLALTIAVVLAIVGSRKLSAIEES